MSILNRLAFAAVECKTRITYRLPVWVVTWIKRPTVRIEFVREDQVPLVIRVHIRCLCVGILRGVQIDGSKVSWHLRDLAGAICASRSEATLIGWSFLEEMTHYRVTFYESGVQKEATSINSRSIPALINKYYIS
jgi:hypothetical protein